VNHLSLFSGIGGIDLAAEWAGMKTVAFVEQNKFCQKVLAKHWPGVPIFDDVKALTKDDISESIDIISGGFPCQPFSKAGSRMGKDDDRHLWPQFARLIEELRPAWVLGENVAGIITLALDDVLADLEALGYTTRAFVIPACAVGAHHRRERVFIVAHSDSIGRIHGETEKHTAEARINAFSDASASSKDVGNTNIIRLQGSTEAGNSQQAQIPIIAGCEVAGTISGYGPGRSRWGFEPAVGRVAHGISGRVDRIKSLGNAVVPQQIYPIMQAIADIERLAA
jgi:DNA (cytosine-5)-methyltransferase 1